MSTFKKGDEVRDKHTGISGKITTVLGNKRHLYRVEIFRRGHIWRFAFELEAQDDD